MDTNISKAIRNSKIHSLQTLNLELNRIGRETIRALSSRESSLHLKNLSIRYNFHVGDAGGTAIAHSPYLTNLQRLDLRETAAHEPKVPPLWPHLIEFHPNKEIESFMVSLFEEV